MNIKVEIRDPASAYYGRTAEVVEVINHAIAGQLYKVAVGNITFIIHAGNTKPVEG